MPGLRKKLDVSRILIENVRAIITGKAENNNDRKDRRI